MRGLLVPVGILGLCLSASTLKLTLDVEPAARRAMVRAVQQMLVRGASVEARRFKVVANRMFYVDEREAEGRLHGIVISDRTDPDRPFLVFAETGEVRLDESRGEMVLLLERGDVHLEPRASGDDRYQRVGFERFEYRINVGEAMGTGGLARPREMTREQLRALVERIETGEETGPLRDPPVHYKTNLYRRYALPAAPALFALVGVPLGIRRKRGARSYGVILCAVLAFGYYALHAFCELLATERGFPPAIAVWLPNVAFAVLGILLVLHARRSA